MQLLCSAKMSFVCIISGKTIASNSVTSIKYSDKNLFMIFFYFINNTAWYRDTTWYHDTSASIVRRFYGIVTTL